jgi:uncharacterized membrane protein
LTVNKHEFINDLGQRLHTLPNSEVQSILQYYVESIDDRMEDGMDEAAAIASLGPLDQLAEKILAQQEVPAKKRRLSPGVIVLLVLGSPIWLSLAIAAFSVALALYITIWAVLGSFFVTAAALALGGIAGVIVSILGAVTPNTLPVRILSSGGSLAAVGLGVLLLPAVLWLISWFARLHKIIYGKFQKEVL